MILKLKFATLMGLRAFKVTWKTMRIISLCKGDTLTVNYSVELTMEL
jgi:hypothetical protein